MGGTTLTTEWTIREVLNWTRGYFEDAGIVQPRLEAEILLAHALDVDRLHLYLAPDKPLTSDERLRYRGVVKQRQSGTPLQHVIGEVRFYGLRFQVDRETLIPRTETEELLDQVVKRAPRDREIRCLDLGTGTGVIAVCMARYLPKAQITAVDISPAALQVAQGNAKLNEVEERIDFIESDWFSHVEGEFDFIASNPPYIRSGELKDLPKEVREHEPSVALDGGIDGLEKVRSIVGQLRAHLRPDGVVLMEIGHDQGASAKAILENIELVDVSIERDMAGRDRFVVGRCPS
ncbi:peptide chain release factor N(5)-glutamine methyltransferase [Candidatus Bipolaricaulota bacterium]